MRSLPSTLLVFSALASTATLTACGSGRTEVLGARDAGPRDGGPARDAGPRRDAGVRDSGPLFDAGLPEPERHRPQAVTCDMTRPSPNITVNPNDPNNECTRHEDCVEGINGRCTGQRFGFLCTYDECFSDAECATVCQCEGAFASDANVCLRMGNCSVDADCGPGGFCSPSFSDCGQFSGTVGYFCHTVNDECTNDSECGDYPWYCRFEQAAGRWTCSDSQCAG